MSVSPPPSPSSSDSARARVVARRNARRAARIRWALLLAMLAAISILTVAVVLQWQARAVVATIQQEDPRFQQRPVNNLPTAVPLGVLVPSPVAASDALPVATRPPLPTRNLPNTLTEPLNVLLVGVDARPTEEAPARSDTLIVAHIDPVAGWVSLLSIPRDSVVLVPDFGWSKINAAYTLGAMNAQALYGSGTSADAGGGALAAETVEQFLGIRIDYIAQVDFNGFQQVVDAVGGVLVDVERPLLDAEYPTDDYGVERVYIPAGLQMLNGRDALIYARSRHGSNDFDRGKRQQQVLRALAARVRGQNALEQAQLLPAAAEVLAANVRTTMPIGDFGVLNSLLSLARSLDADDLAQFSVNPNDVAISMEDGSDIYWDQHDVDALVARWLAGPVASSAGTGVQVMNAAAVEGIAGSVRDTLTQRGVSVVGVGTVAPVASTVILDGSATNDGTARRVAETLGIAKAQVRRVAPADLPPGNASIVVMIGTDYTEWWQKPVE